MDVCILTFRHTYDTCHASLQVCRPSVPKAVHRAWGVTHHSPSFCLLRFRRDNFNGARGPWARAGLGAGEGSFSAADEWAGWWDSWVSRSMPPDAARRPPAHTAWSCLENARGTRCPEERYCFVSRGSVTAFSQSTPFVGNLPSSFVYPVKIKGLPAWGTRCPVSDHRFWLWSYILFFPSRRLGPSIIHYKRPARSS